MEWALLLGFFWRVVSRKGVSYLALNSWWHLMSHSHLCFCTASFSLSLNKTLHKLMSTSFEMVVVEVN